MSRKLSFSSFSLLAGLLMPQMVSASTVHSVVIDLNDPTIIDHISETQLFVFNHTANSTQPLPNGNISANVNVYSDFLVWYQVVFDVPDVHLRDGDTIDVTFSQPPNIVVVNGGHNNTSLGVSIGASGQAVGKSAGSCCIIGGLGVSGFTEDGRDFSKVAVQSQRLGFSSLSPNPIAWSFGRIPFSSLAAPSPLNYYGPVNYPTYGNPAIVASPSPDLVITTMAATATMRSTFGLEGFLLERITLSIITDAVLFSNLGGEEALAVSRGARFVRSFDLELRPIPLGESGAYLAVGFLVATLRFRSSAHRRAVPRPAGT